MDTYKYCLSLRIWHPSRDPREFSNALGLKPDYTDTAGKQRVRKGKQLDYIAERTYWSHQYGPNSNSQDLEEAISEKAHSLLKYKGFFAGIYNEGGKLELFVGLMPEAFNCGFELSPELQKLCSDLNLGLSFDIYGYNPQDTYET